MMCSSIRILAGLAGVALLVTLASMAESHAHPFARAAFGLTGLTR